MLDKFKDELQRQGKSGNTVEAYLIDIKQFKEWLLETQGQETDNITETDIREYRQFLNLQKKLSITSINRKLISIVRFQNYLNSLGESKTRVEVKDVLQKNNFDQEHEVKIVEKKDLFKLKRTIEATNSKRDIAIYYLLFGTGIRVSELVSLGLDDIHITERNGEKKSYSYLLIRSGKGNKSRKIPLHADVVKAVKDYLEVRPSTTSNKFLLGQRGEFTRLAINKLLEKYSKQAQLEFMVTPHMARHSVFTMMIKNGTDVKTVQLLAGHSSSDVTYRYYVTGTTEDKQNAVDNLHI